MFYYLSQLPAWLHAKGHEQWADWLSALNVFQYSTFRSAGAAVTALLLCWWLGPRVMRWLQYLAKQEYVDTAHQSDGISGGSNKQNVPTMGGLLIVASIDLSALLWAQWNPLVTLTLLSMLVLCLLGFYDDYSKVTQQSREAGLSEGAKLFVQIFLALFIAVYLWRLPETRGLITEVMIPFFKNAVLSGPSETMTWSLAAVVGLGVTMAAIVGSSNAVNLTDGLDGLAIGCTLIVSFVFYVFTFIAGNAEIAAELYVPHVRGAVELSVICAAMIGAGLGFLWFNCHPARVFMGDTGSLALGGSLGIMAVLIHQPFVLVIAGGIFVLEALSVILQRGWFKWTRWRTGEGRRIFLMAPLHHHFQKKGWHENQVVMRFYILGILFAVLALATLKLR